MGENLEFVEFSLSSPLPTDSLIDFEKFLRSKKHPIKILKTVSTRYCDDLGLAAPLLYKQRRR